VSVPGVSVPKVASVAAPGVVIPQLSAAPGLGNVAAAAAQGLSLFGSTELMIFYYLR